MAEGSALTDKNDAKRQRQLQVDGVVEKRLTELGIVIPRSTAPAANYVPWTRSGNIVFISGQLPKGEDNQLVKGKLGSNCTVEEGRAAARLCGVNLVAQMREACDGNLDRLRKVLKIEGFVNCTEDFGDMPL